MTRTALLLACLLACAAARTTHGGDSAWTTVFEDSMCSTNTLRQWVAQQGAWTLTARGTQKHGALTDGALRCTWPLAHGAFRVEYEVRSEAPGDLSLFLGANGDDLKGAAFIGVGSSDNSRFVIRLPDGTKAEASGSIEPGTWQRIAVTREAGSLALAVNDAEVLKTADTPDGYAGAFLCLYLWNEGMVRNVRVLRRDSPDAMAFLTPSARERECLAATNPFPALAIDRIPEEVHPVTLYVSPAGDDRWTGSLAEPANDGSDGPLATIQAARDLLRRIRAERGLAGGATVWLRGGAYALREPLVFEPQDSGSVLYADGSARSFVNPVYNPKRPETASFVMDASITYAAWPGEVPVVDGGSPLDGWRVERMGGHTAWTVELPEVREGAWAFRQLFVNGERRQRPRLPEEGFYRIEDVPGLELPAKWGGPKQTEFVCREGDVLPWKTLTDVEIVALHFWIEERFPVTRFDPTARLVTLGRVSRAPLSDDWQDHYAKYYVDNVFEALDTPGEWYLDRHAGKLYYLPMPGETPATTEVVAPRLLQLLRLEGDPDRGRFVKHLRFEGITFRNTDWRHPGEDGAPASGGGYHARSVGEEGKPFAAASQAANDVPGVISMLGAFGCVVRDCRIANAGWYGIELGDGCTENRIVGNDLYDLGGGGVKLNGTDLRDSPARRTGSNRISDNRIHACGRVFHSAVGVLCMIGDRNIISHNHIHDLYYSGISVGWRWGYAESASRDNLVEKNHIHDIGKGWLSDMGGIYTLGVQPGTVLRGNLIHDVTKARYGGWAIYPDEGSSHLVIESNICFRTNGHIFNQHYGRENIVRNNIFAFGEEGIIKYSRPEPHVGFSLQRNILASHGEPFFGGDYGPGGERIESDLNLFWNDADKEAVLCLTQPEDGDALSWSAWQSLGHDRHSRLANPGFRNPEEGDFSLEEDSPALDIGFQPIDLSDVGPRPSPLRE